MNAKYECAIFLTHEANLSYERRQSQSKSTETIAHRTWRSDADYHLIHRVAAVSGRGVARVIFEFAAEHADYLRRDTHEDNAPMRCALESFGFRECGTITVANGTERIAYDWIKESPRNSTSRK